MNKFKLFMKKYGYYCMVGVLVIALGITIGVAAGTEDNTLNTNSADNPVVSVTNPEVLTFTLPMQNPSVIKDFSGEDIVFNSSMGWWECHEGMDLTSENSLVFAIADGEVLSVLEDQLEGTKIVIEHANGLQSVYSLLDSASVKVQAGDMVSKGDQLGMASASEGNENLSGAHLHFELIEDGTKIDPNNYLELEPK